ncbi:MAG: hypothetical protein R3E68_10690 [Burkholderiaceae bacterium]
MLTPVRYFLACFLAVLAPPAPALAGCQQPVEAGTGRPLIEAPRVLVVTHASSEFDARLVSKRGLDEAVRYARNERFPVVYLQDDSPIERYFADDCHPEHRLFSMEGELNADVVARQVYLAGGHLELCLAKTFGALVTQLGRRPPASMTITLPMDAVYSNGRLVEESDPWHADYLRFMQVATYGRPGGEHWPKLSLLETAGLIRTDARMLDYLERALPPFDRSLGKGWRVELSLPTSGTTKVLRKGPGRGAPVLRFEFPETLIPVIQ